MLVPTHQCDLSVTKLIQMTKRELGCRCVVENHIRYAGALQVSGNCNDRQWAIEVRVGPQEQQTFGATLQKQFRVLVHQRRKPVVTRREIEIIFGQQVLLDPPHDAGEVGVAMVGNDYADRFAAPLRQAASEVTRAIVVQFGGFEYSTAGLSSEVPRLR